jgi:hypothetical protein
LKDQKENLPSSDLSKHGPIKVEKKMMYGCSYSSSISRNTSSQQSLKSEYRKEEEEEEEEKKKHNKKVFKRIVISTTHDKKSVCQVPWIKWHKETNGQIR